MEQAFANLQKDGKNDVDNLVKWMKDSKVTDGSKEQEDKARRLFKDVPDKKNVTLEQFKDIMMKLATELKSNFEGLARQLAENFPKVLKDAIGCASNTSVPKFFIAKVINQTKEQEEKVRGYFNDVVDKKNVTLEKFKEVINKVVEEFKTNLEGVTKKLAEHGPKMLQSVVGGATSTLTGFMKDLVPKK